MAEMLNIINSIKSNIENLMLRVEFLEQENIQLKEQLKHRVSDVEKQQKINLLIEEIEECISQLSKIQ